MNTRIFNALKRRHYLDWIPDKIYLKLAFKSMTGKKLNLKNPQTFNEKIQWIKLYDRKSEYTKMVDKYETKRIVANQIGEKYVIPTLGIWNDFEEIDFDKLPNQFVLKCTHDSGGLVICKDKKNLDLIEAEKKLKNSLKRNYYLTGREWPYKDVKPRIIAEKFMSDDRTEKDGLTDFKFFCFNGIPKFLYISQGLEDHNTATISFYDLKGNKLQFKRGDYNEIPGDKFTLPDNFSDMLEIATNLAGNVKSPFIRIDLYEINGEVYFSEYTFSPCSGFMQIEPAEYDKIIGSWIDLRL